MSVTLEQVRAALESEEPDYPKAARGLGPDALPHLELLIAGGNPRLAPKAAYLAGLIGTERCVPAIERAARSGDARVRIAAAAAVQNLPDESASDLLLNLIDDPDVGVQKTALRSVPAHPSAVLRARVEGLSTRSRSQFIRDLSREALGREAPPQTAQAVGARHRELVGAANKSARRRSESRKRLVRAYSKQAQDEAEAAAVAEEIAAEAEEIATGAEGITIEAEGIAAEAEE